ncbi:MAG: hypothetical protein ACYC26_09915 [Phycisphaerales bacterium]
MQVPQNMIETLTEIRDLLLKHDFPGQGSVVGRLVKMAEENSDEFAAEVADGAVWGGAGAVWEVGTFKGHKLPDAEASQDEARFHTAIIRLAEQLDAVGIGTAGSRDIAGILRGWRANGLVL